MPRDGRWGVIAAAAVTAREGDGDRLCARSLECRDDKDMRGCTNGHQGVAHLVYQGKLSIFLGKETFLVQNVQPETQLSTDVQVCQLIPTNPDPMVFLLVSFQEISGNFHPNFIISPGPGGSDYAKLFSDLAACIPPKG